MTGYQYPQEDKTMASLTERLRAEGMAQGMEKGMEKGERALLSRQLQRRFGPLDPQLRHRLEAADHQQLELWAERTLDAGSLADVFQDH